MENNSSLINELLYLEAANVAETPGFMTLLGFEAMVAIMCIFPNCLLIHVLFRASIFPVNLRILLCHLSFNLIWYSVAFEVKAASIMAKLLSGQGPEVLIANAYRCKLSELFNTIPLQNTVYTSLALCFERMYATIFYEKYETQHSKPYLALISIPVIWAISFGNQLNSLFNIDRTKEMPICESLLSATSSSALITLSLSLSSESVCLILSILVFSWNRIKSKRMAINRAQQSLGARFQINQNVQVNTMMTPSMILQSLCYVPNYLFLIFVIFAIDDDKFHTSAQVTMIHCNYLWKLIYAFLHPMVAFWSKAKLYEGLKKHSSLIRIFSRAVRRGNPTIAVEAGDKKDREAKAHFQVLDKMWGEKGQTK